MRHVQKPDLWHDLETSQKLSSGPASESAPFACLKHQIQQPGKRKRSKQSKLHK